MIKKIALLLTIFSILLISCSTTAPQPTAIALPHGTADNQWKGLPIMPGALAGGGDGEHYRFTTKTKSNEIQKFYEKNLKKAGWTVIKFADGKPGPTVLTFTKGSQWLDVSIVPLNDLWIVILKLSSG